MQSFQTFPRFVPLPRCGDPSTSLHFKTFRIMERPFDPPSPPGCERAIPSDGVKARNSEASPNLYTHHHSDLRAPLRPPTSPPILSRLAPSQVARLISQPSPQLRETANGPRTTGGPNKREVMYQVLGGVKRRLMKSVGG